MKYRRTDPDQHGPGQQHPIFMRQRQKQHLKKVDPMPMDSDFGIGLRSVTADHRLQQGCRDLKSECHQPDLPI